MPRQYSACFPGNANQRIIKSRATIPLECQGGVTVGLSVVNGGNFAEIDTFGTGPGSMTVTSVLIHEPAPRKQTQPRLRHYHRTRAGARIRNGILTTRGCLLFAHRQMLI